MLCMPIVTCVSESVPCSVALSQSCEAGRAAAADLRRHAGGAPVDGDAQHVSPAVMLYSHPALNDAFTHMLLRCYALHGPHASSADRRQSLTR